MNKKMKKKKPTDKIPDFMDLNTQKIKIYHQKNNNFFFVFYAHKNKMYLSVKKKTTTNNLYML